jgi:peptide/nickel transport system substrate-binding protein
MKRNSSFTRRAVMRGGVVAVAGGGALMLAACGETVEVIKEVPVEVIKEVQVAGETVVKEVQVEVAGETIIKEIEVPVEVIKEVMVETIIEVPAEVQATTEDAVPGIVVEQYTNIIPLTDWNPVTGGHISWGSFGNPDGFDPATTAGGFEAVAMMEPLYDWSPGNVISPLLASGMPEVSDDRLSWLIPLRNDVKFHDGEPWNADAAIFNFDRFMDEGAVRGRVANNVGSFSKVEKVDEYAIRIHTKEPNALMIKQLLKPFGLMASPKAITEMGEDFQRNPVGTGPWMFKEWEDNVRVTMSRNDDYAHGLPGFRNRGAAYADELSFLQLSNDFTARGLAFEAGEVDSLGIHFNFQQVQRLASVEGVTSIGLLNPGMGQYMPLNTQLWPLDDLVVRQALIHVVDRALVTARFSGGVAPLTFSHLLDPGVLGRNPDVDFMYGWDVSKANKLLDDAGYAKGDDGFRVRDGRRMEISMPNTGGAGSLNAVFKLDVEANLGIFVDIPNMEFSTFAEGMKDGEFHTGYVGIGGSDGDVLWDRFHTSAYGVPGRAWSFFQYDGIPGTATPGSSVDALLDGARVEFDEAKRIKIWQDLEKLLLENAVAIPMVQEMLPFLVNSGLMGGDLFFGASFMPNTTNLYSLSGDN